MYIHHLTSIGNCISRLMQLRIRTHQVIFMLYKCIIIIYRYSVTADLNFNALKSFCVAFTPKSFKLSFPKFTLTQI